MPARAQMSIPIILFRFYHDRDGISTVIRVLFMFFNFLFIKWLSHHESWSNSFPISFHICPLSLHFSSMTKFKRKRKNLKILSRKLQWDTVSHTIKPFVHIYLLPVFIAKSYLSGSRPLVSTTLVILGPQWDSSWILHFCPVLWRSCIFDQQIRYLNTPAHHRWGRCLGGPCYKPSGCGLQGLPSCQFFPVLAIRMRSPALPLLIYLCNNKLWLELVSYSHTLRAGFPSTTTYWPSLLCCQDKV